MFLDHQISAVVSTKAFKVQLLVVREQERAINSGLNSLFWGGGADDTLKVLYICINMFFFTFVNKGDI